MAMANGYTGVGTSESLDLEHPHVKRQRSMKFSLYPARPRTSSKESTTSFPPSPVSPTAPQTQMPLQMAQQPSYIPSREDSLPNCQPPPRSFPLAHNPHPHPNPNPHPNDAPRSFTSPAQIPQNLHRKPSEASRLRALNNGYRSHSSDGRHTPDRRPAVDNFSRPRTPSLRRRNNSPKPLHAATFPLKVHSEEQTPADPASIRDRGLSTSSSQSANQVPNVTHPLRPSASIPDYQSAESIYSRQRTLNNSAYRPARGISRPDSNYSAHRREPPLAGPPGYEDEEVRASFRSALTTSSSFLGTTSTERSSVMTKSSSATSIFGGRDEGMSVDDAIGMYESGFQDSGVEDNYRPETATSAEQDMVSGAEDGVGNSLAIPTQQIIRDSAEIFEGAPMDPPSLKKPSLQNGTLEVKELNRERPGTSRPGTRADVTHFDETRDGYGFRKKTQWVSLEAYEVWNGPYKEHVARRRKKWVAMMKDNNLPTDHPTQFPPKSVKARRFVRKGIPPEWRGAAWFFYAGGHEMLEKHQGKYDELVKQAASGGVSETDDEIIERDLNRTFPDNARFKPDPEPGEIRDSRRIEPETPLLQSLRRVLQAFSIHNPKIGYCQSLNFLAGLLLLFMSEEKSFWMLNIITSIYLPGTHEVNLEGANVDLGVLMAAIKDMMPSIWSKIGGELDGSPFPNRQSMRLPPITLCTTAWFMSCFIGTLPIETTLRVWDVFFYEGSKTLFRIALTIFKVGEVEIKAVTDPMEIFQVVQNLPRKLVDANALLESCFKRRNGFGHISQETIEKGRRERRKGYREERERKAGEVNGGGIKLERRNTKKDKGIFALPGIGGLGKKKRVLGANEV